jgi:PAS domain S-box-containing protein
MMAPSEPFDELVRLFDLSLDAFCIAGFDGYLKLVNPAFARILGYTQEELLARPLMDNVHPDDRESVRAVLGELAHGNDIVGFECRQVCADGSVRALEWNTRTRPEEGVIYGVARDVTDRRVASAELNALRRVATLVAEGAQPQNLFAVVAEEVARVVDVPLVSVARYEPDGTATECASYSSEGPLFPVGSRWSLEGTNVLRLVRTSAEAARIDDYSRLEGEIVDAVRRIGIRSTVGIPIVVAGRLWGAMVVSSTEQLPEGTEARLADFTELLATAIANAESREALQQLADEQAALRRVATLVASAAPPPVVFAAVAEEVGRLLPADRTFIGRYSADDTVTVVAGWNATGGTVGVGNRLPLGERSVSRFVRDTGRPARMDRYSDDDVGAAVTAALGILSAVGAPITVQGRLWGTMMVASTGEEPPSPDTEARLAAFTELIATAIANAEGQAALTASRARIVATADHTRRRIERDLHDGAQQRLVSLALQLQAAQAAVPPELEELQAELDHVAAGLTDVQDELREFARGIHPAVLAEGGLGPALRTLARRSPVPVDLQVHVEGRLPEQVEVTAYYVVAEALTNVAKHAGASVVQVEVDTEDGLARLSIRDDGVGGADPARGSGLVGLKDRVEASGGTLRVQSHPDKGTSLLVELPIDTGQPFRPELTALQEMIELGLRGRFAT